MRLAGWEQRAESDAGPFRRLAGRCLLFHSMETASFDGGMNTLTVRGVWPQLAYDHRARRKVQGIDTERAGKALANLAGGVETNRWGVIQVEMPFYADHAAELTDDELHNIAVDVVVPLMYAHGIKLVAPKFVGREAGTIATTHAPQRFTFVAWLAFDGICGHQHAPENDHWDPGRLNVPRIMEHARAALGLDQEDEDVARVTNDTRGQWWHLSGTRKKRITKEGASELAFFKLADELKGPQPDSVLNCFTDDDLALTRTLAALRTLVTWIAALFGRKSAKIPPPEIEG